MLAKEKDYVLVTEKEDNPRTTLAKINQIASKIAYCTDVKDSHIPRLRRDFEVPISRIIAIVDTEHSSFNKTFRTPIYRGKKPHDAVGALNFFYKPDQETGQKIIKAFDKIVKIFDQQRLDFLIDSSQAVWEIYPHTGEKYAGMYRRSSKPEKNPHRFMIRPESLTPDWYTYVIAHEYGHHLHSEFMTSRKLNAQWIKLYKSTILVKDVDKKQTTRILNALLDQEAPPSDFKGQLEEDDATAFKWIIKAIRTQHKLSIKELDAYFLAEFFDEIQEVWPDAVTTNDLAPLVTEYSTVSYRELLAESFAYYITGRELPKAVLKLLEDSIAFAKANTVKP
jgi:hypothetical protein